MHGRARERRRRGSVPASLPLISGTYTTIKVFGRPQNTLPKFAMWSARGGGDMASAHAVHEPLVSAQLSLKAHPCTCSEGTNCTREARLG